MCLCRAGYLPQSIPLQIICYLSEEDEFLPWHAASRALYQLDKLLDRTKDYSIFSVSEFTTELGSTFSVLVHLRLKEDNGSYFDPYLYHERKEPCG